MGEKTFQAFLLLLLINFTAIGADALKCSDSLDLSQAKNVTQLEALAHPKCLGLYLEKISHQKYQNLDTWEENYKVLEVAGRLPETWKLFKKSQAFLYNEKAQMKSFDESWQFVSDLKHSQKDQLSLSQFIEAQSYFKEEILKRRRSSAALRTLKAALPGLY